MNGCNPSPFITLFTWGKLKRCDVDRRLLWFLGAENIAQLRVHTSTTRAIDKSKDLLNSQRTILFNGKTLPRSEVRLS